MSAVNCHFHWLPRGYFDALCKRVRYPRAEPDGRGYTYWFAGGRRRESVPPEMFDLEGLLMGQEAALGPGVQVISSLSTLALLDEVIGEEALELAELFNSEVAGAQAQHEGFWGTAAVPLADPGVAVAALDVAARYDLRGVSLPGGINGRPIYNSGLETFYERAAALRMPLFLHPTDIALESAFPDDPASKPLTAFEQVEGVSLGGALQLSLGRLFDSSIAAMRLVLSGVMDRHPELRILHFHAGGVLPYIAGRLDKNARVDGMTGPASSYIKRMYTDTVSQQPLSLRMAIDFYGPDHVCFGDDFPCWNPTAALDGLDSIGLDGRDRTTIMSESIRQIFDLRPTSQRLGSPDPPRQGSRIATGRRVHSARRLSLAVDEARGDCRDPR